MKTKLTNTDRYFVPVEIPEIARFSPDTLFSTYADYILSDNKDRLSPKTYSRYVSLLVRINAGIGHIPLGSLQPYHIKQLYKNLGQDGINLRDGTVLAETTIHHHHELISMILTEAVRDRIITENVADNTHLKPPKRAAKEADCLNEDELLLLLKISSLETIKWRAIILLLICCGLRRGELLGLDWSDIDFRNNQIHIRKSSGYTTKDGIYTKSTKTERSMRILPMAEPIKSVLLDYRTWWQGEKDKRNWDKSCDRLFLQNCGKPMHPDSVTDKLHKLGERYGFRLYPHKLRHTFCTILIDRNIPINQVSALAGHTSAATTLSVYTHRIKSTELRSLSVMEEVMTL
jgi:integrase